MGPPGLLSSWLCALETREATSNSRVRTRTKRGELCMCWEGQARRKASPDVSTGAGAADRVWKRSRLAGGRLWSGGSPMLQMLAGILCI